MEWLHFVGRSYYTIPGFEKEALKLGASRKASLTMLSAFSWGDRIWLAQGDMKKKNRITPISESIVFGSFSLSCLSGLTPEAIEYLEAADLDLDEVSGPEEHHVVRGCGEYVIDRSYQTESTLPDIAVLLRELTNPGEILLQGSYTPLVQRVLLPEVTFRWGFRRFPELGESATPREDIKSAIVQTVSNYTTAKMYSTLVRQEV